MKIKDLIYKRDNGIWYLRIPSKLSGKKKKRISLNTTDKDIAISSAEKEINHYLLVDAMSRVRIPEQITATAQPPILQPEIEAITPPPLSLEKMLNLYVQEKIENNADMKPTTRKYYSNTKSGVFRYVDSSTNVSDITKLMLNEVNQNMIDSGKSQDYRHAIISFISKAFHFAYRTGLIKRNPLDGYKPPRPIDVVIKFFTEEQEIKLLEYLKGHDEAAHTYEATYIALKTGMRVGEIYAMLYSWIDGGHIVIPAPDAKASRTRQIPIHPDLKIFLDKKQADAVKKDGYVLSKDGGVTDYQYYNRKLYKEALKAIDCPDYDFHTTRHTFASKYLAHNPGHLNELMLICGWQKSEIASKYIHVSRRYKEGMLDRISKL